MKVFWAATMPQPSLPRWMTRVISECRTSPGIRPSPSSSVWACAMITFGASSRASSTSTIMWEFRYGPA